MAVPPPYPTQDPGYPPAQPADPGYPPAAAATPPYPPASQPYPPAAGMPEQPPAAQYPGQPGVAPQPMDQKPPMEMVNPVAVAAPAPAAQTTVVVTQIPGAMLGSLPATITCASCSKTVTTRITTSIGAFAWLMCVLLAFLGCFFGCCLIPFCVPSFHEVTHHCPNCGNCVGRCSRL